MGEAGSRRRLQAIVVGNSASGLVCGTADLLREYGVEFAVCEDIYSVVAKLAKNTYSDVLVIGRLEQLSREDGRFFQKMNEKGFSCCCLADGGCEQKRKQVSAATAAGAFVINQLGQIEEVIAKLPAEYSDSSAARKTNNTAAVFNRNDFRTTQAELDALLGSN